MFAETRKAWSPLVLTLLLATSGGCPSDPPTTPPPAVKIDAAGARKLVLAKYRSLFSDKYFQQDGDYHRFPPLSEASFDSVVLKDDVWQVRCEPLAGYVVTGRVSSSGEWVDLDEVGFSQL